MLKSLLRRVGAALGLSLLIGQVPAAARAPQVARPALWEVSDADTTIYLFGTIHLLPADIQWQTPQLKKAVASSQQLVVETIVDDKDPTKLMSAMASLAFNTPNLPPLLERVPAAKRPALAAAIKQTGYPPQALDRMETWAAAFILLGNKFREMGLSGGVEGVLRGDFASPGKPVGELESNLDQLSFFDRLPEAAQRSAAGRRDRGQQGDGRRLRRDARRPGRRATSRRSRETFDRDLAASPALQEALIKQRNANWSKWIETAPNPAGFAPDRGRRRPPRRARIRCSNC